MTGTAKSPFNPEHTPSTILLVDPPLVRVLVQVRFAPVLAVSNESFVGSFQQALAERYPIGSSDFEFAMTLAASAEPPPSPTQTRLWRFASVDGSSRVTLATSFVSFETERYEGHEAFLAALSDALEAVEEHIKPAQVQRVGIRYLQRLADTDDLERLGEFFRPDILGVVASSNAAAHLDLCLTQARHSLDGMTLSARWGLLPDGVGLDIGDAAPGPSWVFDIDVFDEARSPFDPAEIVEKAKHYSRRQYQFFRWAVEPAFLERFGASASDIGRLTEEMSA